MSWTEGFQVSPGSQALLWVEEKLWHGGRSEVAVGLNCVWRSFSILCNLSPLLGLEEEV